jgi:hypothetical protein
MTFFNKLVDEDLYFLIRAYGSASLDHDGFRVLISSIKWEGKKKHFPCGRNFSCLTAVLIKLDCPDLPRHVLGCGGATTPAASQCRGANATDRDSRTALVNAARGLTKSHRELLKKCGTEQMNRGCSEGLSQELREALDPLLREIESLNERIKEYDRRIEQISQGSLSGSGAAATSKRRGDVDCVDVRFNAGRSTPIPSQPRCGMFSWTASRTQELRSERAATAHQQGSHLMLMFEGKITFPIGRNFGTRVFIGIHCPIRHRPRHNLGVSFSIQM